MPCTKMTFAGSALFVAALTASASTQSSPPTMSAPAAKAMGAPTSVVPTGLGEAIDCDVTRLKAATARFKSSRRRRMPRAIRRRPTACRMQPHGAMGYRFGNKALKDATLDVEKPEVLVYEKRPDGTFHLNGVEFFVPFTAWDEGRTALDHGPEPEARRVARLLVPPRLEPSPATRRGCSRTGIPT